MPIIPTNRNAQKLLLGVGLFNLYSDLYTHITNIKQGAPALNGAIFLGPNTNTKEILYEQLSTQQLPFMLYGDGKRTLPCTHKTLTSDRKDTNHILLYSYEKEGTAINICTDPSKNTFNTFGNLVHMPFYLNWLGHTGLHFEIAGDYRNSTEHILKEDLKSLPIGSTITITAAMDHQPLHSVNDELFLKSFTYYNTNPYVRFVTHLVTNPDDTKLGINLGTNVQIVKTDIDQMQEFSDLDVMSWQQEQIQNFISVFRNTTSILNGRNEREFSHFIDTNLSEDFSITSWLSDHQNIHRYKELLLFNHISKSNFNEVRALIDNGVNIDAETSTGLTPLNTATYFNNVPITQFLIESNAAIDTKISPLITAVMNNSTDTTEFLLQSGISPDIRDQIGNTPLLLASSKGYNSIANLLINFYADVNAQNNNKQIPLTVASALGHNQIVTYLLDAGAIVDHITNDGYTPFILAASNNQIETTKLLSAYTENTNPSSIENSMLMINQALKYGHERLTTIQAIDNIEASVVTNYPEQTQTIKNCLYDLDLQFSYDNFSELRGICVTLEN